MTIPDAPQLPDPHPPVTVPGYYTPDEVAAFGQAWLARDKAQTAEIERLSALVDQPQASGRFPGDPGKGKIYLGAAVKPESHIADHEKAAGVPLGVNRNYWNGGPGDLAVPAAGAQPDPKKHPVAYQAVLDHKAGRIGLLSTKIQSGQGLGQVAAGKFDAPILAWIRWLESAGILTAWINDHEPENNYKNDAGNMAKMKQHAADFRADQAHIRDLINQATGGKPKFTIFGGSVMSYGFSKQGVQRYGPGSEWYPGDGIWDFYGIDHYAPAGTPVFNDQWNATSKFILSTKTPVAVTELGFRSKVPGQGDDPDGPAKLQTVYNWLIANGGVLLSYFDSDMDSDGFGWVMHGALLDLFHKLMTDPRTAHLPAAA